MFNREPLRNAILFCMLCALQATCIAQGTSGTGEARPSVASVALGHFTGRAVSKSGRTIPLSLDLVSSEGSLIGTATTTVGSFTILQDARSKFDDKGFSLILRGDAGDGRLTLSREGTALTGTYVFGDDSGTVLLTLVSNTVQSATDSAAALRIPLLIVGVYHMANPELDSVRFVADDVLTPKRQREMEILAAQLAAFHPTQVLVEAPLNDSSWLQRFISYTKGDSTLSRNEIEQIGFRVAKDQGLGQVGGIDYPMFLNGLRPDEIRTNLVLAAKGLTTDQSVASLEGHQDSDQSSEEHVLANMTISQYIARLNTPQSLLSQQAQYMSMLIPDNGSALYEKADLVSNWYKRNLRIFENINRFSHLGDRVLVVIGAGHAALLRQFAADSNYFAVVDPSLYLAPHQVSKSK